MKPLKDIEALQDEADNLNDDVNELQGIARQQQEQISLLQRQLVGIFVLFLILLVAVIWLVVRR